MTSDIAGPPPGPGPGPQLEGLAQGAAWSGLSAVVMRAGTFVMGIVTARLLAPEDFGVFAVALTVHLILISLSELGLGAALSRHTGDVRGLAPTVATLALATSTGLAVLMVVTAPWVASRLGSPGSAGAVRVLALTLLASGVATVPVALVTRDFRQDKRFAAEAVGFVVSAVVLLVLVTRGWGAMGLAWSRVAGAVATTAVIVQLVPERYRPGFDAHQARQLVMFGVPLASAGLTGVALGGIDYVIVARSLGSTELGLYVLAYTISGWPISIFTSTIRGVGVPAFARVRDDPDRLPLHVGSALRMVVTLALPISALCAALASPLVASVYGPKWVEAASALALLAIFGAIRIALDLFDSAIVALGATKQLLVVQVTWLAVLAPALVIGVRTLGIVGAALAHVCVATLVVVPMYTLLLGRLAGVDGVVLVRAVGRPVVSAVAAGVAAHGVASRLSSPWAGLVAGSVVGAACYLVALGQWLPSLRAEWRSLWTMPTTRTGGVLLPGTVDP